jgi:hypothetical protein
MNHEHVRVAVSGAERPGAEDVPARKTTDGWELLRSPLYATQVAAGDVIRMIDRDAGSFEIVRRGGNISVQFYLAAHDMDNIEATTEIANEIESELAALGGRMDGKTAGLIVFSIPISAGFATVEKVFELAAHRHIGAQWQYGNVYDPLTQEPLLWWQ